MVKPLAVGCAALAIFLATLHPSIGDGDSSELSMAGHLLTVPHPPGYPLLMLLIKLWELAVVFVVGTLLPAAAMPAVFVIHNSLAAVLSSVTLVVLYQAGTTMGLSAWASVMGAAVFAFAPGVRTYATQIEVFCLNNLLISLILYFAARFDRAVRLAERCAARSALLLGSLCCGLAMSNQHTAVFVIVPTAAFVLLRHPAAIKSSVAVACAIFVGLLPYAALVFVTNSPALFKFGFLNSGSLETFDGLVAHFLRRDYGTFTLATQSNAMQASPTQNFENYAHFTRQGVLRYLWVLGCVPLLVPRMSGEDTVSWRYRCLLAMCVAPYVGFMSYFSNLDMNNPLNAKEVMPRFWFQPLAPLCLLVAGGADCVLRFLFPPSRGALRSVMFPLIACTVILAQVTLGWEDFSDRHTLADAARFVLRSLPKDAVFIPSCDISQFHVTAVAYVAEERPDILILPKSHLHRRSFVKHLVAATDMEFPPTMIGAPEQGSPFNPKLFFDTLIKKYHRRVFLMNGNGDEVWDVPLLASAYAMSYLGRVNEFVPIERHQLLGEEVMSVEPLPNAWEDWRQRNARATDNQPSRFATYLRELLPSLSLHYPLPVSFTARAAPVGSWEELTLRYFVASMQSNAMQLLEFASYDAFAERDVQLPAELAEQLVSHGSSPFQLSESFLENAFSVGADTKVPPRYVMLAAVRLLAIRNTNIGFEAENVDRRVEDYSTWWMAMQQIMRFHMCPSPHEALAREVESVGAELLRLMATVGSDGMEAVSSGAVREYLRWLRKQRKSTRHSC